MNLFKPPYIYMFASNFDTPYLFKFLVFVFAVMKSDMVRSCDKTTIFQHVINI
jgi:hypothetical protein